MGFTIRFGSRPIANFTGAPGRIANHGNLEYGARRGHNAGHFVRFNSRVQMNEGISLTSGAHAEVPDNSPQNILVPRPPRRHSVGSVTLYMPAQINVSQKANYGEPEMGIAVGSVISGMKMILEYEDNNDNDIVIFSHEDCYVKNINLFNKNINILKNNIYDIICREYDAPLTKNHYEKYYMFDTFFIKKTSIKKIFEKTNIVEEFYDFGEKPLNYEDYHSKNKKFCEAHFTEIIKNFNIYSILYGGISEERIFLTEFGKFEGYGTWKNTELGFYHIPGRIH